MTTTEIVHTFLEVIDLWEAPATCADLAKALGQRTFKVAAALKFLTSEGVLIRQDVCEKSLYLPPAKQERNLIQEYLCTGRVML